jgi:hypothetical protein
MLATLLFAAGLAQAASGQPVTGNWGGAHVRLSILKDAVEAEFDCGHGSLGEPPVPGRDGRFSVTGSYAAEHGGPTLKDESVRTRPARYEGSVAGERMSLKVVIEGGDTLGPFELTRGGRPRLMKCR